MEESLLATLEVDENETPSQPSSSHSLGFDSESDNEAVHLGRGPVKRAVNYQRFSKKNAM